MHTDPCVQTAYRHVELWDFFENNYAILTIGLLSRVYSSLVYDKRQNTRIYTYYIMCMHSCSIKYLQQILCDFLGAESVHATAHVWRLEYNSQELVSFYLVDSWNQTWVVRLGGRRSYPILTAILMALI